jgi:hypothetical protein
MRCCEVNVEPKDETESPFCPRYRPCGQPGYAAVTCREVIVACREHAEQLELDGWEVEWPAGRDLCMLHEQG